MNVKERKLKRKEVAVILARRKGRRRLQTGNSWGGMAYLTYLSVSLSVCLLVIARHFKTYILEGMYGQIRMCLNIHAYTNIY